MQGDFKKKVNQTDSIAKVCVCVRVLEGKRELVQEIGVWNQELSCC